GLPPYVGNNEPYTTEEVNNFIGGSMVPRVVVDLSHQSLRNPNILSPVGYRYDALLDKYHMGDQSVDFVYLGDQLPHFSMPGNLKQLFNYATWVNLPDKANAHPVLDLATYVRTAAADLDSAMN